MILRGADDLIMRGGRHLLTLVLKGSRAKDVLAQSLDQSPAHGFYKNLPAEEVQARIDWVIRQHYLAIEYSWRLPLLVYTPEGWAIEKETFSDELLDKIEGAIDSGQQPDMGDLKDRNREVIWRLLDKIEARGDRRYIPALKAWEQIDYRKVRERIRGVIHGLQGESPEAGRDGEGIEATSATPRQEPENEHSPNPRATCLDGETSVGRPDEENQALARWNDAGARRPGHRLSPVEVGSTPTGVSLEASAEPVQARGALAPLCSGSGRPRARCAPDPRGSWAAMAQP